MTDHKQFTFEEIFKQNENRVHYQMHKLGIRDQDGEFYSEGIYAMWRAYKRYEPDKGPMSTYFNYTIRYSLLDLMRKKIQQKEKEQAYLNKEITSITSGNRSSNSSLIPIPEMKIIDEKLWKDVFSHLTVKQRKWVYYAIIRDMPLKEIADKEGVTVEAVKSWGKQARKKLRKVLIIE
ncbi:sigma-70 family RNA polymerase sigma factor [Oceanobacillus luteolus]|uniref:Sigma-70 family RNA polymerase sigma factor n=1 Tax=Oceanobacillus luteolus TaxID=1274358 RepID=A0ABW4HVM6_9BACI